MMTTGTTTEQHTITRRQGEAFLRNKGYELRVPVDREPLLFSHVYQHPTEKWWTFGDNTGRVHVAPTLSYRTADGALAEVETDEPRIEACAGSRHAYWVFRQKKEST